MDMFNAYPFCPSNRPSFVFSPRDMPRTETQRCGRVYVSRQILVLSSRQTSPRLTTTAGYAPFAGLSVISSPDQLTWPG